MATQSHGQTPDKRSLDHATRVRQVLHGQRGPQATAGGWGRRALFQCPYCGRPWLMDGPLSQADLDQETLRQVADDLGATLADLPDAPCSACAEAQARFRVDRDEYITADGRCVGYGFNVEGDDPPDAHVVLLVQHANEWMRHLTRGLEPRAHIPVHPDIERGVWAWLAHLNAPSAAEQYFRDRAAGDPNPPGHGAPGTEAWRWGGAFWVATCPPLGGPGLVHLALAIPPREQITVSGLVTICRSIAHGVLVEPMFFT